ncbi:hypothetical protein HYC85_031782 [Camellia sinensis]|uniref:Uncharacterized protein n=1 Tax=Camellia sinensis TaxID=4442 RepID=A0A7J7FRN8_CAMSI|nr:hypothetical protein HYC85_031782 [Camellia sinensis]
MEINPRSQPKLIIPRRRPGQIKLRILGIIAKSALSVAAKAHKLVRRRREDGGGGPLSSTTTTPHATPSGYNSDDHSDG